MDEPEVVGLSGLKESVAPLELDRTALDPQGPTSDFYPFATVLRLRVLQIVCGITFLIIGTVALIEEKGDFNLGLGIPAGAATILAAAASIHTTRGFGGYHSSSCMPGSSLRFLGPSVKIAIPLVILWGTACSFLGALVVQSTKTLIGQENGQINFEEYEINNDDIIILAIVELSMAVLTLLAVLLLVRIDCKYDPD